MLRSWSEPFREAHGHRLDVRWYELSLVESAVSASFQILQHTKHLPLDRCMLMPLDEGILQLLTKHFDPVRPGLVPPRTEQSWRQLQYCL